MGVSEIQNFYKGAHVFVTGATGFLGMVLLEKLLRCTEVEKIYVLIRAKRNVDEKTRFDEIFEDTVFEKMKIARPDYKKRVSLIVGNLVENDFAISDSDKEMLSENIEVFFHLAATIRFDENIIKAYKINVESTIKCVTLARKMKKLKSFIYVSTAYSNCIYKEVGEKFYDYSISYEEIGKIIENFDDDEIQGRFSKIVGDWPNTYTFTKALTESFIRKNSEGLPIGIFRPGIVLSSYKEPYEGWTNNKTGLVKICHLLCLGQLRVFPVDTECHVDIVPVDYCVSALIASSWGVSNSYKTGTPQIPIYNFVNSPENSLTAGELFTLTCINARRYPFLEQSWAVMLLKPKNATYYTFCKLFAHYLPAFCLDVLFLLFFQKPKHVIFYKWLHYYLQLLKPFAIKEWKFDNSNVVQLWKNMSQADKELFPFDMNEILWLKYFRNYVKGIRVYLQKDPMKTLEEAKNRQNMLVFAHHATKLVFLSVTVILVYKVVAGLFTVFTIY